MIKEIPMIYRDTGCRLHPSCLRCPRPRCIHDEPGSGELMWIIRQRHAEIMRRVQEGEPAVHIAAQLGISERTVHRIVQRERSVT